MIKRRQPGQLTVQMHLFLEREVGSVQVIVLGGEHGCTARDVPPGKLAVRLARAIELVRTSRHVEHHALLYQGT